MKNPVFIVDGFTEKLIMEKICPGKKVIRTDLNGKQVTIIAIARKISTLIRALGNRNYPIIILIDKEDRIDDCDKLIKDLHAELINCGINNQDLRIGVADRMLENWIIADWNCLSSDKAKPKVTESINGNSFIKKTLGSYSKTTDGVDLFLKANHSIIYENSPSFKLFIDNIIDIPCEFTKKFKK